ncbi:nucleotidyltransferase domain-containing protein [Actinacidiphila epipremni]|uniref:Nucleotidyltransferase n=1 Tax=Actinacidiphila epipremni TaxID=2053013 RepID=A0ABX0ZYN0_9ACTN|nr:nucleotidyltransferase domain-containing protein [Actinacidiphila epipremni]NJP47817.1 nucleotidyltransferase [Actinacidiphila epipremni]
MEHRSPGAGVGLAPDGTILREGSLARVQPEFAAVVEAARTRIGAAWGGRLHSAYVYGSVPRGTARVGRSDLDLLVVLREAPAPADREAAGGLEAALDRDFPVVDGVGVLLFDAATLLSELERHDLGFFVACLCTPLLGPDLAARLPRYRPDTLLARETNGDLALALPGWQARRASARTDAELRALCRVAARRVVRTGFTLVMPRWGGWTSSLDAQAEAFAGYYPERGAAMRRAAGWASAPTADPAALAALLDDLGPWLVPVYRAAHGPKAPRPPAA